MLIHSYVPRLGYCCTIQWCSLHVHLSANVNLMIDYIYIVHTSTPSLICDSLCCLLYSIQLCIRKEKRVRYLPTYLGIQQEYRFSDRSKDTIYAFLLSCYLYRCHCRRNWNQSGAHINIHSPYLTSRWFNNIRFAGIPLLTCLACVQGRFGRYVKTPTYLNPKHCSLLNSYLSPENANSCSYKLQHCCWFIGRMDLPLWLGLLSTKGVALSLRGS